MRITYSHDYCLIATRAVPLTLAESKRRQAVKPSAANRDGSLLRIKYGRAKKGSRRWHLNQARQDLIASVELEEEDLTCAPAAVETLFAVLMRDAFALQVRLSVESTPRVPLIFTLRVILHTLAMGGPPINYLPGTLKMLVAWFVDIAEIFPLRMAGNCRGMRLRIREAPKR
jgi:hypothetical protein